MEDIERIEVGRGPGGAVWEPRLQRRHQHHHKKAFRRIMVISFSTTHRQRIRRHLPHIRVAGHNERWGLACLGRPTKEVKPPTPRGDGRMYCAFPHLKPMIGFDDYIARDFFRSWKYDTRSRIYPIRKLASPIRPGPCVLPIRRPRSVGYYPMKNASVAESTRLFTRLRTPV
jgi:hypothetical protein